MPGISLCCTFLLTVLPTSRASCCSASRDGRREGRQLPLLLLLLPCAAGGNKPDQSFGQKIKYIEWHFFHASKFCFFVIVLKLAFFVPHQRESRVERQNTDSIYLKDSDTPFLILRHDPLPSPPLPLEVGGAKVRMPYICTRTFHQ